MQSLIPASKEYVTRDLYLAATLCTLKFQMIGIDYQIEGTGRKTPVGYFKFMNDERLQEAEKKFWAGQLAIEPRAFITSMRALKAEVTNAYKGPHSVC